MLPLVDRAEEIAVPVIVLGEYRYGIRQSRFRCGYEGWIVEQLPRWRILSVDLDTTGSYADVRSDLQRAGRPVPANDLWIAALARQHGLPLLSRDQRFDFIPGLKRIAW